MNMSFVRIASLYGKYLLAPRLKNATKFVVGGLDIKGLDSLGAMMAPYAHQSVRNYCSSAGSAGVFEEWIYKNRSKDFSRLPMGLKFPNCKAAMEYAVKRHNLKMGTQLEIVDLGKRGNIRFSSSFSSEATSVSSIFVKDDKGKYKKLASVAVWMDGKYVAARPLLASSLIYKF